MIKDSYRLLTPILEFALVHNMTPRLTWWEWGTAKNTYDCSFSTKCISRSGKLRIKMSKFILKIAETLYVKGFIFCTWIIFFLQISWKKTLRGNLFCHLRKGPPTSWGLILFIAGNAQNNSSPKKVMVKLKSTKSLQPAGDWQRWIVLWYVCPQCNT
jgi:hypothetical protein